MQTASTPARLSCVDSWSSIVHEAQRTIHFTTNGTPEGEIGGEVAEDSPNATRIGDTSGSRISKGLAG